MGPHWALDVIHIIFLMLIAIASNIYILHRLRPIFRNWLTWHYSNRVACFSRSHPSADKKTVARDFSFSLWALHFRREGVGWTLRSPPKPLCFVSWSRRRWARVQRSGVTPTAVLRRFNHWVRSWLGSWGVVVIVDVWAVGRVCRGNG